MPDTRYPQFCALARAAEVIGERWTLLIVRELLLGPKRFTDLRDRLDGISPSVLTERLARAEELELVRRVVTTLRRRLPVIDVDDCMLLGQAGQGPRHLVRERSQLSHQGQRLEAGSDVLQKRRGDTIVRTPKPRFGPGDDFR